MNKGASFSPCRKYRYALWRIWDESKPFLVGLCLNPSTADENFDDPTVAGMVKRARAWGYGGLVMLNIFAWRSTDPKGLLIPADPVGPDNDFAIMCWAFPLDEPPRKIICAWGSSSKLVPARAAAVLAMLRKHGADLNYLRMGKTQPWHPLYLKHSMEPTAWL